MKGITKIALAIALVAILVLSIVVASVAWFTSNPEVNANNVTLDAARTLIVVFDSTINGTNYRYNGEKGNAAAGDVNAPYVYEAGYFNAAIHPSANDKRGRVKMEFGTVLIEYHPGSISNVLLTDLFTVTANCYREDGAGDYVQVDNLFVPYDAGSHGGLTRYSMTNYEISNDGYLMDGAEEARFADGSYAFTFTYTFLPSASYEAWEDGDYENIAGYERSGSGDYVGVTAYVPYEAKYHYGLTRYAYSEGAYVESETGTFVKTISEYLPYSSVQKYAQSGGGYVSSESGTYQKIAGVDEYVLFPRYNKINGFPYSHERYMDATYTFTVVCSVEEV